MRSTSAVGHPRRTEKPPGTPSGRRLRLEIAKSPVERLFPPSGGVSRGSVRVGGETFLLPSYGFSFGYKRKGVSITPLTSTQRDIVGHKMRVNALTGRGYNPSVKPLKTKKLDSSPYTGEPRTRSVCLAEHRGRRGRSRTDAQIRRCAKAPKSPMLMQVCWRRST